MQSFSCSPLEIPRSFWRNRELIWALTKREVLGRYQGSLLGLSWSFFNPLLMLVVYTFVFSTVFNARWGLGESENRATYAIFLFVGLLIHGLFSECVNRAPQLVVGNVSYVKKVVFPLEILPWVALGSALFHMGISLILLLLAQLIFNGSLPWSVIVFPCVAIPLIFATMGFAWFLAATGVYIRDIGQTTGLFTTVLLFMSPVFYPISALPVSFQTALLLNPLTFIIEQSRAVLLLGQMPEWFGLILYTVISIAVAWLGFYWFQKARKGFADVI